MTENDPHEERMQIRRAIQKGGHGLFESLSDIPNLQWISGDLQGLNEDWAINHKGTYGFDQLMKTGYSNNQMKWIKDLRKEIRTLKRLSKHSADFYSERCHALQHIQSKMRDPERQAVCEILANGKTALFQEEPRPPGLCPQGTVIHIGTDEDYIECHSINECDYQESSDGPHPLCGREAAALAVAEQERPLIPTHRCRVCGTLWQRCTGSDCGQQPVHWHQRTPWKEEQKKCCEKRTGWTQLLDPLSDLPIYAITPAEAAEESGRGK